MTGIPPIKTRALEGNRQGTECLYAAEKDVEAEDVRSTGVASRKWHQTRVFGHQRQSDRIRGSSIEEFTALLILSNLGQPKSDRRLAYLESFLRENIKTGAPKHNIFCLSIE